MTYHWSSSSGVLSPVQERRSSIPLLLLGLLWVPLCHVPWGIGRGCDKSMSLLWACWGSDGLWWRYKPRGSRLQGTRLKPSPVSGTYWPRSWGRLIRWLDFVSRESHEGDVDWAQSFFVYLYLQICWEVDNVGRTPIINQHPPGDEICNSHCND